MPIPSIIYAVGAEHSSFHCFSDTRFYLFSYELDFCVNKEILLKAQYYVVGDPIEGTNKQKLVDIRAVGKFLRIGYFDVIWKKRKDPVISNIRYDKGIVTKKEQEDFMIRLENATRKLYDARHKDEDKNVVKTIAFVEVEKVFPILTSPTAYYFRKTLIPLELSFSGTGVKLPVIATKTAAPDMNPKSDLYRISQHFGFDTGKKKLFLLGTPNTPISFSGANKGIKRNIFDYLIRESGVMEVSDLIEELGIKRLSGRSEREIFNDLIADIRRRFISDSSPDEAKEVFRIEKSVIYLSKFEEK